MNDADLDAISARCEHKSPCDVHILIGEVRRLMAQRDELHAANTQEVMRRRELQRCV